MAKNKDASIWKKELQAKNEKEEERQIFYAEKSNKCPKCGNPVLWEKISYK